MTTLREAAQRVIDLHDMDYVERMRQFSHKDDWLLACRRARDVLHSKLAQQQAEPVQEPQRKPLSVTDLQDALVYTCLIDRDAIEDPEGYDTGSTVAQINALHEILTRKPT